MKMVDRCINCGTKFVIDVNEKHYSAYVNGKQLALAAPELNKVQRLMICCRLCKQCAIRCARC